ncbi:MAG TPA: GIY-YIG nuclease family protein [Bacteroidia bacterium]|nr:GIY-YIG nuclease family protein [Bacteroidia bacterium]
MYYTYVIKSLPKNYIYIGITDNLKRRLNQHNLGYNKTTKPYAPFILIFYKSFPTRPEARKCEIDFKKSYWRERFRKLNTEIHID